MDDNYEFVEGPGGGLLMVEDKVASRTLAYITLLNALRNTKEPELMAEGLEMMKRLRMSIGVHSEARLGLVKGDKGN